MQGGGQQSGAPPLGGAGGAAMQKDAEASIKSISTINFVFIVIKLLTVNILKNIEIVIFV